jgi:uncharacterized membrane protein
MNLDREIDRWVDEGLISSEQAEAIRGRYADARTTERRGRLVQVLAALGAVVVGFGVILFFAANWSEIPRAARLAVLIATLLASYGAGYYVRELRGTHRTVGHALYLLGAILFGAGLFLVGQMYHVQAHDPLGFLVWAAAALATAFVVRSGPVAALAILAFGAWMFHEVYVLEDRDYSVVAYIPVLAALYGAALYGFGTWGARRLDSRRFGGPMRTFGYVLAVLGTFVFTFRDFVGELGDEVSKQPTVILTLLFAFAAGGVVVGALLITAQGRPTRVWEGVAVMAVPSLVLLTLFIPEASGNGFDDPGPIVYPLLFNLLVAALALGAVVVGYYNDEVWLVNAGIAFVAIDVIARYFDFFWGMLDRSIAFIGAGVLILALAFFLERQRSRLVERIQQ